MNKRTLITVCLVAHILGIGVGYLLFHSDAPQDALSPLAAKKQASSGKKDKPSRISEKRNAAISSPSETKTTRPSTYKQLQTTLDPLARDPLLRQWIREEITKNGAATLDTIENTLTGAEKIIALEEAYKALFQQNPEEAIRQIETLPDGAMKQQLILNLATDWAVTDVNAVLNWVLRMPDGSFEGDVQHLVLTRYINTCPEEAVNLILSMPDDEFRADLIPVVARSLASKDIDTALTFIQALPNTPEKNDAMLNVINQLAILDMTAAFDLALNWKDSQYQQEMIISTMETQARKNPAEGIPMLRRIQNEETQNQAVYLIVDQWANSDLTAANEWIARQPRGSQKDVAIRALVDNIADYQPDCAFSTALQVSDEQMRENMLLRAVQTWIYKDEAATLRAIDNAPLPAEVKDRLRRFAKE